MGRGRPSLAGGLMMCLLGLVEFLLQLLGLLLLRQLAHRHAAWPPLPLPLPLPRCRIIVMMLVQCDSQAAAAPNPKVQPKGARGVCGSFSDAHLLRPALLCGLPAQLHSEVDRVVAAAAAPLELEAPLQRHRRLAPARLEVHLGLDGEVVPAPLRKDSGERRHGTQSVEWLARLVAAS